MVMHYTLYTAIKIILQQNLITIINNFKRLTKVHNLNSIFVSNSSLLS